MAHLTVEGTFENGRIELAEIPPGVQRSRVIVTFVPDTVAPPDKQSRTRDKLSAERTAPKTRQDRYPQALRTEYHELLHKKLKHALTPEDAIRLDAVRAEINRLDHLSDSWKVQEEQAMQMDLALAQIRQELESLPDA